MPTELTPARPQRRFRSRPPLALLAATLATAGCAATTAASAAPSGNTHLNASSAATCAVSVVAAGDMNQLSDTQATGRLAQAQHPDVVATLGDQQYPAGSLADYRRAYGSTDWGQLKSRTRPVPGNHEYRTPGASGYFTYFGGPPRYYGYDLGCGWRGYALNSEVDVASQARWLKQDLAAHPGVEVLAYWHRPRYSSGVEHGPDPAMQPFWDALASRHGVVLNGHEHNYERFAPRGGMQEFVVGTGGSASYPFRSPLTPGSAKAIPHTPGVLTLSLSPGAYTWRFLATGGSVRDSGRG